MSVEEFGIKVVGILFLLLHYYSGRELASYLQQLNFLGQVSPGIKSGPGRIHGPRKNRWGTAWQGTIPPSATLSPMAGGLQFDCSIAPYAWRARAGSALRKPFVESRVISCFLSTQVLHPRAHLPSHPELSEPFEDWCLASLHRYCWK